MIIDLDQRISEENWTFLLFTPAAHFSLSGLVTELFTRFVYVTSINSVLLRRECSLMFIYSTVRIFQIFLSFIRRISASDFSSMTFVVKNKTIFLQFNVKMFLVEFQQLVIIQSRQPFSTIFRPPPSHRKN